MSSVISIDALHVRAGGKFRLSVPELRVNAAETVAVIGPNGSGKTTLLNAVAGLTAIDSGRGTVLDVDLGSLTRQHAPRRELGVQLQNLRQHPGLMVGEIVRLHNAIYRRSSPELLKLLGLLELRRRYYGALSQGQRRRVNLYLAMAHEPRLLVLDEPTADLDDKYRRIVRSLIGERAQQTKSSVLFSTHVVEDLLVADRIIWLRDGQAVAAGTLEELTSRYLAPFKGVLDLKDAKVAGEVPQEALAAIAAVVLSPSSLRFVLFGTEEMQDPFHRYALRPDIEGYSYGPTRPADLLAFISGSYGEYAHRL